MDLHFNDNFSINYELTDDEKKKILKDFSDNFTQAHKLMAWIEDPNVPLKDRVEYFPHMFFIFESMDKLIKMLLAAKLTEKEIISALNDIPF